MNQTPEALKKTPNSKHFAQVDRNYEDIKKHLEKYISQPENVPQV